jgi:hypothetical protein
LFILYAIKLRDAANAIDLLFFIAAGTRFVFERSLFLDESMKPVIERADSTLTNFC